jgi:hypothetical protein
MNDPNGMFVDEDGIWHLYYQCMSYASRCLKLLTTRQPDGYRRWQSALGSRYFP